ncbi:MAG TPA: FlgD immunoglobulin-like domain containing protein [Candidatus Eisenbacteria bacterium]|nr:FlgD immunoglobulin-like domain containing protein [Candidatus Eisenbacteria bacterium]
MLLVVACAAWPLLAQGSEIDSDPSTPPPAPGSPSPTIAQSPTGNAITVTLAWTAPGDDSLSGIATAYDMRYSSAPIYDWNFGSGTKVIGMPVPGAPGTLQSVAVSNLLSGTTYYFAIKTADERGNWSGISNVVVKTGGTASTPGIAMGELDFAAPSPNPARSSTSFQFALPHEDRVQADAFDIMGRHVRTLLSGTRPAGHGQVSWDLSDEAGAALPAGIYLVRATLGNQSFNRRVVIVR